jgi:hypothetical protein
MVQVFNLDQYDLKFVTSVRQSLRKGVPDSVNAWCVKKESGLL